MTVSFLELVWALPMMGSAMSLLAGSRWRRATSLLSISLIGVSVLLATFGLAVAWSSGFRVLHFSAGWFTVAGKAVGVGVMLDGLSAVLSTAVSLISFLISAYSYSYMAEDEGIGRYWFFFDYFVGSMLMLVLASNLVLLLVGWEGTTLSSYALIGHWYTDEEDRWVGDKGRRALGVPMWSTPSSSAVRAMVFTSFADIGFMIGVGMLYGAAGTFSLLTISKEMPVILDRLQAQGLLIPFLVLFSMGAFAKSAQFPFHEWLVTAMTGPTSVSALIHAATMVNAGVYFMLRFMPMFLLGASADDLTSSILPFFLYVALIGAFTAFMMASQAMVSNELKLILAYSTSSQLGYMFLAVGLAPFTQPSLAFFAALSHLLSQALFKAALFLAAGALIHAFSSRYVKDMGRAWAGMKATALAFALASLSLAGIPPLSGFWDKDLILDLAYKAGIWGAYGLGLAGAFFTSFYVFRAFMLIFFGPEEGHRVGISIHEPSAWMLLPYAALSGLTLAYGVIWPGEQGAASLLYSLVSKDSPAPLAVFQISLSPSLVALSLGIALAGLALAVFAYAGRRELNTSSLPASKVISSFLYDRWLINSLYYRVIVDGFDWLSKAFERFESQGFDRAYNVWLPSAFAKASRKVRKLQGKGSITTYLAAMFAGALIFLLIYMLLVIYP